MTRIQVITSGDGFSTADVCRGLIDGLQANGAEVVISELTDGLEVMTLAADLLKPYTAPPWARDAFALVAPRIIGQAAWMQPAAVIAVTGLKLHASVPLTLRKMGIPVALLCTESPYEETEQQIAPMYDYIFTNERTAVPLFGDRPGVHYLPHAYNPAVHQPGPSDADKQVDALFIGTGFPERKALFDAVNWDGINLMRSGAAWHYDPADDLNRLPLDQIWDGIIDNAETAAWYRSARININHHRTSAGWGSGEYISAAESLGPRAYEIAACQGFQLCDDSRPELVDVFGGAAATYRAGDSADLERQTRYWLQHEARRAEMAAAQHAAVTPHTWTDRARRILEVII